MAAATNQDFKTYQGDDVFPVFTVLDASGNPLDISTVAQITWYTHRTADDDAAVTLTKTGGGIVFTTDGTDGKFTVNLLASYTALLTGWYQHLASIADSSGYVTTVEVGRLNVGVKPTWTYDPGSLGDVPLFQVRRLLGDVIDNDQQMQDGEILWAIDARGGNVWAAAADCARSLAAQYARKPDVSSPGGMTTNYNEESRKYLDLAATLDQQNRQRGAGVIAYAGGISVADKVANQQDTDRVQPSFNIGMDDNLTIPLPPVGQETPTQPMGTGGQNQSGI